MRYQLRYTPIVMRERIINALHPDCARKGTTFFLKQEKIRLEINTNGLISTKNNLFVEIFS